MNGQITTAAELDALPIGSVVMTERTIHPCNVHPGADPVDRRVWQKFGGKPYWLDGTPRHEWQATDGGYERVGATEEAAEDGGPTHYWIPGSGTVTVLYRPDAPPVIPGQDRGKPNEEQVARAIWESGTPADSDETWETVEQQERDEFRQDARAVLALFAQCSPTENEVAETLLQYETSGMCHLGKTCGLCDCGRAEQTPERQREWDAHQLDRARAVLALIPPQRCAPSEDEVAEVIAPDRWREIHDPGCPDGVDPQEWDRAFAESVRQAKDPSLVAARAVLALFGDRPTVAQVKAEGIREACDQIAGMLARKDADAPFSIRVTDLLEALARQAESGAEHG